MDIDQILYDSLEESKINLILTLPCFMLKGLINIIEERNEIPCISITREEEGVGIAAGAYLGGKVSALLIQNSGLGNSVNAIKSLLELYQIPIIFIMSHRGDKDEKIIAQIPMGEFTPKLLASLSIDTYFIESKEDIKNIKKYVNNSIESHQSIAILLKRSLWMK